MPTIAEIITIYPIAQYLAVKDIKEKGLFGGGVPVLLPEKIYNIGKSIQRIYDDDPTDSTLTQTANYLYSLCGKYGLQAMNVAVRAGSVSPVTPTSSLPQPLDFIVSASSIIPTNGTQLSITAFIGYNLSFVRGGVTQYTTNPGSGTYYSWNRNTGLFQLYGDAPTNGAAQLGEQFLITPIG